MWQQGVQHVFHFLFFFVKRMDMGDIGDKDHGMATAGHHITVVPDGVPGGLEWSTATKGI